MDEGDEGTREQMNPRTPAFYWSPASPMVHEWIPRGGWNTAWSPEDRMVAAARHRHLVAHGQRPDIAEQKVLAEMFVPYKSISPSIVAKKSTV